jgi:GNAT superfamily N-acetyltransferase
MEYRLDTVEAPGEAERAAVVAQLTAFNAENGYPPDTQPLAVLLRDGAGEAVGGLWGKTGYGWLFVEFLSVPEALRGRDFGSSLMAAAEALARERGCVGAWLTTFSFQARGFYERLGYTVFGELENSPGKNVRIFLRKRL